jgi:hypothetical protein
MVKAGKFEDHSHPVLHHTAHAGMLFAEHATQGQLCCWYSMLSQLLDPLAIDKSKNIQAWYCNITSQRLLHAYTRLCAETAHMHFLQLADLKKQTVAAGLLWPLPEKPERPAGQSFHEMRIFFSKGHRCVCFGQNFYFLQECSFWLS